MTVPRERLIVADAVTVALAECPPRHAHVVRVPVSVCVSASPVARAACATIEQTGAGPPPRA